MVLAALLIAGPTASCARLWLPSGRGASGTAPSYLMQFDSLWSRFDTQYPSFEYKGVDWQAQRVLYRGRVQRVRSQAEFVALAGEMLEPLRDLHVWFVDPRGQAVPTYRPTQEKNFDAERWHRALHDAGHLRREGDISEATVGNYGYLFIGSWDGPVDVTALDVTLARVRDAPGLIIDLRTNGGGSDATALAFASRFTTRSFAASYVQVRNGPRHGDLGAPSARMVSPRGSWQYIRPVVVIAGRAGYSATESFVAAMRTLPNVMVIGDTTGGASGNPATFALGNGWSYTVPQWIEFGPDHQPIEWQGVAPHLALLWAPESYERDRDPLIDAAVGLLGERNGLFRVTPAGGDTAESAATAKPPLRGRGR